MSKTKRFYWLKLPEDFFRDPLIKKLRRVAGGDTYTCIHLKLMLHTINDGGLITYEGIEPTLEEELALRLDEDVTNVKVLLTFLTVHNQLVEQDNERHLLIAVPNMVGSETAAAERKRKQRQRDKKASVTLSHKGHTLVTARHTEKEKEEEERREEDYIGKTILTEGIYFRIEGIDFDEKRVSVCRENGTVKATITYQDIRAIDLQMEAAS